MIVVTGRTGVGKTTILKRLDADIIYLDDVVKDVFYKRNFRLYWDIKEQFGKEFVSFRKVKTKKLGTLVFNEPNQLEKLNAVAFPYIKTYLEVLKQTNPNAIVEMAIYMNHEDEFKDMFDKVILVDRKPHLENKFKYINEEIQPIKAKKIKADLVIKEENLDIVTIALSDYLKINY